MRSDSGSGYSPGTDRWRQRLAELGIRWRQIALEPASLELASAALRERVKELNCLYAISQLMEREMFSFKDILAKVVDILPPSWQYPEIACARITMVGGTYDSLHFRPSEWHISSPIFFQGAVAGEVTVYYTESCPDEDEGPFLKEERHLIDSVAERIGNLAVRKLAESRLNVTNRQLEIERTALRETNTALQAVLDRIEVEKNEIQQTVVENVGHIVMPIVRELTLTASPDQAEYIALLEKNLNHIVSPFVRRLSLDHQTLTTTELRICDMIRSGLGSKEIAHLRGISIATVSRHREHIRRKLGIANTKVNLVTHLQNTA